MLIVNYYCQNSNPTTNESHSHHMPRREYPAVCIMRLTVSVCVNEERPPPDQLFCVRPSLFPQLICRDYFLIIKSLSPHTFSFSGTDFPPS